MTSNDPRPSPHYPEPLATLAPAPALFDAPQGMMTGCETQYWLDVKTVATRAFFLAVHAWAPWAPGPGARSGTRVPAGAVRALCQLLAEDLLPHLNLTAEEIQEHLLYLAQAYGLLADNGHHGPRLRVLVPDPAMGACAHIISLALEGQMPEAALDGWYTLLGGRCPRCATHALGRRPANSRIQGAGQICTACAHDEAMRASHDGGTR